MIIALVIWLVLTYAGIAVDANSLANSIYAKQVRTNVLLFGALSFGFVILLGLPSTWHFALRLLISLLAIPLHYVAVIPLALMLLFKARMGLRNPPIFRRFVLPLYMRHSNDLADVAQLVIRPHKDEGTLNGSLFSRNARLEGAK
jgi:hypothetical protein